MRTYDSLVTRIIVIISVLLGIVCLSNFLTLDPDSSLILFLILITIALIGVIVTIHYLVLLRQERELIHSRLDDLQQNGITIYRKKYERLLYTRDVADLPPLTRFLFNLNVLAIIQPKDHQEVRKTIKLCEEFRIPIIPRGTGTSGYGGVLPTRNGIVLLLSHLSSVISLDLENKEVEVESGMIWNHLREQLVSKGYDLLVYPSSAPSSTIGGWVSSGGFGIGSSLYGDIAQIVTSQTIIGTDGKEFILKEPRDFIGNFGTLGIIWKVKLKINRVTPLYHAALIPNSLKDGMELIEVIQQQNPYFLRFIDTRSITWKEEIESKVIKPSLEGLPGVIAYSFEEDKGLKKKQEEINKALKNTNPIILAKELAEELWEERFYTLRSKRKGPSLIISEVLIPTSSLNEYLLLLEKKFNKESYILEIVSTSEQYSMVMVWFPTDIRKWDLPIIGSLPYLFHWIRAFIVIDIAWKVNGTTYNNGGLWLAPYPKKENISIIPKIIKKKKETDPNSIFNPDKVISGNIPRFFPILPWSIFLKISFPFMNLFYKILPKRYR